MMHENEYTMCVQSFDQTSCLSQRQKIHVGGNFESCAMGSLVPCKVWLSADSFSGTLIEVVFTPSFLTQ